LANGYAIKGLPKGLESIILSELYKKLPAPEKITIKKEITEKIGTRIDADFYHKDNVIKSYNFLIGKMASS